jgi:hexosaminidase
MNFIPKPNGTVREQAGIFTLRDSLSINPGDFEPYVIRAFERRAAGLGVTVTSAAGAASVTLVRKPGYAPEQYTLDIGERGITVSAAFERGIIWGLTSLYQAIAERNGGVELSACVLEDAPRYGHRALMLDCARHFFAAAEVERIIEEMSLVKLNVLHWHLSDDQGWRIESRAFPKLSGLDGQPYYTQDEIRHVVSFAKERGVEVIPEIDMPGHTTAIIAAYPELSCKGEPVSLASGGGIFKVILCAGKDRTYSFLFTLLDEVAALFESPYFHLGGDEAPKTEWEQCDDCKAYKEKMGLATFEDLQGHFTACLAEHLRQSGKTVVCWNDVLNAAALPENLTVQYWIEWGDPQKTAAFYGKGGSVVFSDMFSLYLDYPASFSSLKKVYNYRPVIGSRDCSDGANTVGIEACLWSERIITPQNLETAIFPRLFAMAEAGWTRDRDYGNFEKRLIAKLEGLKSRGIAFTPIDQSNPEGEARSAAIAQFFQAMSANMAGAASTIDPEMLAGMLKVMVQGFDLPPEALAAFKQ